MRPARLLALACAAAALVIPVAPATADEPCWEYEQGGVLIGRGVGSAYIVVRGPGTLTVTPTDCV